jgi:hypothetical protein
MLNYGQCYLIKYKKNINKNNFENQIAVYNKNIITSITNVQSKKANLTFRCPIFRSTTQYLNRKMQPAVGYIRFLSIELRIYYVRATQVL